MESQQISFEIRGQLYSLDINQVLAVEQAAGISPVLGAPDYIEGVITLRGDVIPVYSVVNKFHLGGEYPADSRLLLVKLGEMTVAVHVDSVIGIINVPEEHITGRPKMISASGTDFVGHVEEVDGKILLVLELDRLIPKEERQEMQDLLDAGEE